MAEARRHDEASRERSSWPDTRSAGPTDPPVGVWYRSWDTVEHERLAEIHRSRAGAIDAEFAEACAGLSGNEITMSPLQRYGVGGWNTTTGAIVYLSPEAGNPDRLLAQLRCHRAWMMLGPSNMQDCPLDLPGLAVDARGDDHVQVGRLERGRRVAAGEVEELPDDPVHLVDVGDHSGAQRLVREPHLDAEPQARERRAQVVRHAGQQQRAVLLDPGEIARHRVEPAVDRGDLGWTGLGQRRRHLAAADAHDGGVQVAQRAREVAREPVRGGEQEREHRQRPHQRARGEFVRRWARRDRDADPVARARRDDAHEQHLRARGEADLRLRPQAVAQAFGHLLHQRTRRRLPAHRALGLGDDAYAVLAGQAFERLPALRAVGAGKCGAQRLQLDEPRLAELPVEHRGALGAEHDDAHQHRQRDDRHEQQHEAPEQRARQQRHVLPLRGAAPGPPPSASAASGT